MVGSILLLALGLSLIAWQIRGMAGRMRPHPSPLRTVPGATAVFVAAGTCFISGLAQIRGQDSAIAIIFLAGLAALSLAWVWPYFQNPALRALGMELRHDFEAYRRDYPDLDEEALFRFLVRDRRPGWTLSQIEDLTADCPNLGSLAQNLIKAGFWAGV